MTTEKNTAENKCTRITKNMVINGSISSSDNLLIEGQIFGNISTSADLTANNLIIGDVKANNMSFNSAKIKGNINTDGALAVDKNTIVVGDISADALKISGKVNGDVNAKQYVLLTNSTLVVGDIKAAVVTTQAGSRIKGTITTITNISKEDIDTEFDLGTIPDPESDELFTEGKPEVQQEEVAEVVDTVEEAAEEAASSETTEGGNF